MEFKHNPYARFEDKADLEVPPEILQIYDGINGEARERKKGPANRCSSATMCVRRNWYENNLYEGTPLTPRKLINFMLGDLTELTLQTYIRRYCVGAGKIYSEVDFGEHQGVQNVNGNYVNFYKQKTLSFSLPDGTEITGHIDGLGKRNSDGKWELIECKSAANWGFDSFKKEGAKDYLKQAHACMLTNELREMNVKEVRYWFLRKETGHIWSKLEKYQDSIAEEVFKNFIAQNKEEIPDKPHELTEETYRRKPTGRMIANFPCTYCPYLTQCHGELKTDWKKDQFGYMKPVFVKEQDV